MLELAIKHALPLDSDHADHGANWNGDIFTIFAWTMFIAVSLRQILFYMVGNRRFVHIIHNITRIKCIVGLCI